MALYIQHYVTEMDESMMQRCLYCGEVVSDYRNAMWPADQGPPRGFPTGELYVSVGFPTIITNQPPPPPIQDCRMLPPKPEVNKYELDF